MNVCGGTKHVFFCLAAISHGIYYYIGLLAILLFSSPPSSSEYYERTAIRSEPVTLLVMLEPWNFEHPCMYVRTYASAYLCLRSSSGPR